MTSPTTSPPPSGRGQREGVQTVGLKAQTFEYPRPDPPPQGEGINFVEYSSVFFICTAFITSLFFTGGHNWYYAPALLSLLCGFLISALPSLWRGRALPASPPALLLLAFSIYITVSLLWSQTPFPSLVTWLVLCSLPLSFFGLSMASARTLRWTCLLLQTSLIILATGALAQVTVLHTRFPGRAAWPLQDANNLAALFNLGLLPMLATALAAPRGTARRLGAAGSILLFGGLAATGSRAGMLCGLIAITLLLFTLRRGYEKRWMMLGGALACVAVLILLTAPHAGGHLSALALTQDEAAMNRPVLWRATLGMIAEHPFTGTGLGSFYLAYAGHRPVADRVSAGQWAHNDLLQFAAEAGILAPLLFAAFLASLIVGHAQALRACRDDDARARLSGPLLGFCALALHSMVEFQFYVMPSLIVAGAWLAAWNEQSRSHIAKLSPSLREGLGEGVRTVGLKDQPSEHPHPNPPLQGEGVKKAAFYHPVPWQNAIYSITLIAVAVMLAIPAVRGAAADYWLNRAITAAQNGKPQSFSAYLDRADAVAPGSFIDAKMQRAGLYIDLLRTPGGLFTPADRRAMSRYVLSTLDLAGRTMPLWYDVDAKRAALYLAMKTGLGPDWETRAESELQAALAKNPLDSDSRLQLITLLAARGDMTEAQAEAERGLERPHDNAADAALRTEIQKSEARSLKK